MPKANVVYWYGLSGMPRDGGGLRALAWHDALIELGFDSSIVALRREDDLAVTTSPLRSVKRALLPMPFTSRLPQMEVADVNIVTVPSVFAAAAASLPRKTLVFDWMDLWSVNARTVGGSSWLSRPGGTIQSKLWSRREKYLVRQAAMNTFAGYEDSLSSAANSSASAFWIPTPIEAMPVSQRESSSARLRVGFIGNFAYPPNVASLRSFFMRYGKAFDKIGIEVVVAGFGSEIVRSWNVSAAVLGQVDSLRDFYSGIDASIVPIVHGGGIKAKAVESMAYGVPVFGTNHVRSGFSPKWATYIGDIDELLAPNPRFPPVPDADMVGLQFSQTAFKNAVGQMLGDIDLSGT